MRNEVAVWALAHIWHPVAGLFFRLGSPISVYCLATSFLIALGTIAVRRGLQREVRLAVLARALFPRRFFRSRSSKLDAIFFVGSTFFFVAVLGWTMGSARFFSTGTAKVLQSLIGAVHPEQPGFAAKVFATVVMFVAAELAYWTNHYASHKVPWLWEFHKVHHTAEVLTPITNWRVHPVDTIVYSWFSAVFIGVAAGALKYWLGPSALPLGPQGTNIILLLFYLTTVSLQHSHVWIATTGALGRIILSPAHHQVHHSADRRHFDKNFGLCLAVWDWMAGTLCVPDKRREPIAYGVLTVANDPHSLWGSLVAPFVNAARSVVQTARAIRINDIQRERGTATAR